MTSVANSRASPNSSSAITPKISLRPNRVDDTGFWFLARANDDEYLYVALVNEQDRLVIDGADRPVELFGRFDTARAVRSLLAKLTNEAVPGPQRTDSTKS
jgi:hypothetical protein